MLLANWTEVSVPLVDGFRIKTDSLDSYNEVHLFFGEGRPA